MKMTKRKYDEIVAKRKEMQKKLRRINKKNGKCKIKSDSTNTETIVSEEDILNLRRRIRESEKVLEEAEIIDSTESDKVQIGSRIVISYDGEDKTHELAVGFADSKLCTTSPNTPLGRKIIGKSAGDEIVYKHNGIENKVKLLEVKT